MSYATTIKPRPPFMLFVPSLDEIPADVREQHKGQFFALGEFYPTLGEAKKKVKEAGYNGKQVQVLAEQKYFARVV